MWLQPISLQFLDCMEIFDRILYTKRLIKGGINHAIREPVGRVCSIRACLSPWAAPTTLKDGADVMDGISASKYQVMLFGP